MTFLGKTVFVLCSLLPALAQGQEGDENPFRTPARSSAVGSSQPEAVATSLDSFQFSGIMKMDGRVRISIQDTQSKKGYWLTEGEVGEMGLTFQRFDEENETIVLVQGGVNRKLALNEVKIEPLKIAAAPKVPAMAAPAIVRDPQRAENDEEARARIQRVAEEIRRRREERRKQLENANN